MPNPNEAPPCLNSNVNGLDLGLDHMGDSINLLLITNANTATMALYLMESILLCTISLRL
ncbi:hypothetical protein [Caldivirga maquilingensis]|uniref:hypothetical protein n=1 Tax=Caldivirga maquilingensis TaxID=76887 RepID=UPI000ABD9A4A|nr:hypothetical protein [Caldivirga maquilingensis]